MQAGLTNDYSAFFSHGTFTSDWTSEHFQIWAALLAGRRDQPVDILEIGTFEGRSAIFFLEYLPHSTIVCVDRFVSKSDIGYRDRFRRNTRRYGKRIEAITSESVLALHALLPGARRFDLVYVDGSHARDDVLIDSLLSWRLLKVGGTLIWDDYELALPVAAGPKEAIDTALKLFEGQYEELHRGWQVAVRKTAERKSFYRSTPALSPLTLRRFLAGRTARRTPLNFLRLLAGRLG